MSDGKSALAAATGNANETYSFNAAGVLENMFKRHGKTRADASNVYSLQAMTH